MGRWYDGAQCAVMLTFDLDAETLWLAGSLEHLDKPGMLSQGTYGARVGTPLLLELLRRNNLRATFFIPGWVAEHHPDIVETIHEQGHEIGHHGYLHERPTELSREQEAEVLQKGIEALRAITGEAPQGYRSPAWEFSAHTLELLAAAGFRYSSNLMSHFLPWKHPGTEVIELPVQWLLDDAPFFLFGPGRTSRPIQPAAAALQAWQEEFRGIYHYGGLFNLTMHPQLSGRPGRVLMLQQLIDFIRAFPHVWFATGSEVAAYWAEHVRAHPDEARQGEQYDPAYRVTHP